MIPIANAKTMRRTSLHRLLLPKSLAIVGASENASHLRGILDFMKSSEVEIHLVNPSQSVVHGLKAHRSLTEIGKPVDAVLSLVNAERAVTVVSEARTAGAGGVVIFAAGFREAGEEGKDLERRLIAAAADMPLLGPNCNGFTDFRRRVKVSAHPPVSARPGSIGLVTHSGGMIGAVALSGYDRAIGLSHAISVGNEATVDLVDGLEFLVNHPGTKAICLIIEQIARPEAFFAALDRATQAGKPVIALKLARAERSQRIAKSHTGAIAGDSWVYDAAFRQHGVINVRTLSQMLDSVACFDHLPTTKWSALDGLAVLTTSGGGSSLSSDVFADSDAALPLPEFEALQPDLQRLVPGVDVANPLDMTGFAVGNKELHNAIFKLFEGSPQSDALMLQWFINSAAMPMGGTMLESFAAQARGSAKPFMFCTIDDAGLTEWAASRAREGIAVFRGLESAGRALKSMRTFVAHRKRPRIWLQTEGALVPAPAPADLVASAVGPMLTFKAAMDLLETAGVRVAPYRMIAADVALNDLRVDLAGPFVVKLADVPHRTELGAVRLGVTSDRVSEAVAEMRALALLHKVPSTVVVQTQLNLDGEAFVGIQAQTPLGPFVACGVGGVFVEVFKKVAGARAPFGDADAQAMLDELGETKVFEGVRGKPGWNRDCLAQAVLAVERLARGSTSWMDALDINPLAFSNGEFIALDCLCTVRNSQ